MISSRSDRFKEGDEVLVTGCGLGENHDGGYGEVVRFQQLGLFDAQAGLRVRNIQYGWLYSRSLCPSFEAKWADSDHGLSVVTGASGGVESLAISMLASRLWYYGLWKKDQYDRLKSIGASECMTVEVWIWEQTLRTARFGGAIDNVGGEVLEGLIRHTNL